jgi:hypothetical protein
MLPNVKKLVPLLFAVVLAAGSCGKKENATQNVAVVTPIDPGPYGEATTATRKVLFIGTA